MLGKLGGFGSLELFGLEDETAAFMKADAPVVAEPSGGGRNLWKFWTAFLRSAPLWGIRIVT